MRTNGFAFFRGPDAWGLAEKAVLRVQRFCREQVVSAAPTVLGDGCVVAYALDEDRGLPLVHGFADGGKEGREASGEYALMALEGDALVALRDRLGTRPLYADEAGSMIATDHRFFQRPARLLPNGARLVVGSTEMTTTALAPTGGWSSLDECAPELAWLLREAVAKRVRGRRKVAISFSGGLDSSLIALLAAEETEVVLCSAYASGSRDQEQTKAAADALGLELAAVEMDRTSAAREVRSLDLPFEATPMDRALWSIYSTTAREAAAHGAELIMLGQLADELFGGYMKYGLAARESEEAAAAMMLADVLGSGERAFVRDEEACARFTEARFPFADESVAAFALGVPVGFKIREGERKVVLRRAASLLGLPESLAAAPKKAAQYSSGVAKLLP